MQSCSLSLKAVVTSAPLGVLKAANEANGDACDGPAVPGREKNGKVILLDSGEDLDSSSIFLDATVKIKRKGIKNSKQVAKEYHRNRLFQF